jgi:hypothetical protein
MYDGLFQGFITQNGEVVGICVSKHATSNKQLLQLPPANMSP